ncbi:protein FAM200B-like [Aphis craccivora]|uniref:Protein FAM200B-like n=1 Tax=Aphis craccivora TaxID=307492 RepID=A0A6G0YFP7_APHCR|nr:protein FAM200B-like [Aphis craccivora]
MSTTIQKTNTPKKKRAARNELRAKEKERVNRKLFRQDWLNHEDFKYWLKEIPNNKLKWKKHSDNVKSLRGLKNMSSFVNRPSETSTKELHVVKTADIKLAAFFAENNVAFQLVDKLAPLLKEIFNDSNTAQKLQLHRHKCSSILKNIIAPVQENLLKKQFRLFKIIPSLFWFVHPEDWKIHTRLLELEAINATDCSAQKLCEELKECLKSKDVSLSNLIGVASDGANSDLPNLVLMQCICYSSARAASKATALLPRSAEDLVRSVSTYISGSEKRTAIIEEIQEFFGEQRKKMLKLADTRWLAMHQCVVRILDYWNSLTHYFLVAVSEDHLKSAITILDAFNNFNLLKTFAQNFIEPEFLMIDSLEQLSFSDPKIFLPESEIFVGTECEDFLKTLP